MNRIDTPLVQEYENNHMEKLRSLAPECMFFLKRNGDFPLEHTGKVALFGNGARQTLKGGTGSGDVNVRHFVTIEEGLKNAGFVITSQAWLDAYDKVRQESHEVFVESIKEKASEMGIPAIMLGMGAIMPEPEYSLSLEGEAETAIYVLSRICGEGADRKSIPGDFKLTETEKRDISELQEKYGKFMLVLNVGGVVDLSEISTINNILLLSQLGTVTGDAFVDVLIGKSYPSGKLTSTWAAAEDYPDIGDFGNPDDTRYREGIYVGYRYFDAVEKNPIYPFGYGLGYTDFALECDEISLNGNEIQLSIQVKNIGHFPGKETVQVYYSAPFGVLDKPYQELATFQKTKELNPGDSQRMAITFPVDKMASYDESSTSFLLEKGEYILRVGNSSQNTVVCGVAVLEQNIIMEQLQHVGGAWDFTDWKPDQLLLRKDDLSALEDVAKIFILPHDIKKMNRKTDRVVQKEKLESNLLETVNIDDIISLCIGNYKEEEGSKSVIGAAAHLVAGAAGETTGRLNEHGLASLVLADGPAGLRLSTEYVIGEQGIRPLDSGVSADMLAFADEALIEAFGMQDIINQTKPEGQRYYQYCSAIPIGTAIAQSWNPSLAKECGDIVGDEMERLGIHLWLAPALNIHRSPLCGRNFEYYSEDPYISGTMAAAVTQGVQEHKGCGVTIKHFVCNNQETNRFCSNSIVSERALREIYLKGFEICVKEANPCAVMSSYNLLNGEHTCNRRDLLTDVLRGEWNFKGIVMSDWGITGKGFGRSTKYSYASAAGCIYAGNDLIMPGNAADKENILNALYNQENAYPLSINDIHICADRVIRLIRQLTEQ